MKGLREIVLAGALSIMGCDARKDIVVKEGKINDLRVEIIYRCNRSYSDNVRVELYDSNNALRFRGIILERKGNSEFGVQFDGDTLLRDGNEYLRNPDCGD